MTNELETEAAAAIDTPRSVVRSQYKARYAQREAAMTRRPKGISRKALARSSGDWLAIELARYALDDKAKLIVALFDQVLSDNGIDPTRWNRTTKGWQGRLRMSGRLALEPIVAAQGFVAIDGEQIAAPKSWIAAHTR
jgi:hypothetical protein